MIDYVEMATHGAMQSSPHHDQLIVFDSDEWVHAACYLSCAAIMGATAFQHQSVLETRVAVVVAGETKSTRQRGGTRRARSAPQAKQSLVHHTLRMKSRHHPSWTVTILQNVSIAEFAGNSNFIHRIQLSGWRKPRLKACPVGPRCLDMLRNPTLISHVVHRRVTAQKASAFNACDQSAWVPHTTIILSDHNLPEKNIKSCQHSNNSSETPTRHKTI